MTSLKHSALSQQISDINTTLELFYRDSTVHVPPVSSSCTRNQSLTPPGRTKGLGHDWNLNKGTLSEVKGPLSRKIQC